MKNINFFQEFFVLRGSGGSNHVTVPCILLGHCSNKYTVKFLQDIRVLKILSTSSDFEITSGRINLESSLACKKVLKLSNI